MDKVRTLPHINMFSKWCAFGQTSVKLRFVLKTHQTVRFHTAVFAVFPPSTLTDRKTLLSLKRNPAIVIICVCACYWMTSLCSKRFLSLFILIRRECFLKCSYSKQRFQICGVFFSRTSQFFSILFEREMFVQYVIAIRPPFPFRQALLSVFTFLSLYWEDIFLLQECQDALLHGEKGLKIICVGAVWQSWNLLKDGEKLVFFALFSERSSTK